MVRREPEQASRRLACDQNVCGENGLDLAEERGRRSTGRQIPGEEHGDGGGQWLNVRTVLLVNEGYQMMGDKQEMRQ